MPLAGTEAALAASIVSAIGADAAAQAKWELIAKAILDHIVANGVVVVSSGAGAPGGGHYLMNSADIALLIQDDQSIDIGLQANDLTQDFGFKTAILISLFSDRRADDDELSAEDTTKRGWWGDLFPDVEGDLIGSKLWLLRREKRTQENLNRAEEFAVEALTWMVEDGVADDVVADASYDDNGTMILTITLTSPGTNAQAAFKFKLKWGLEEERN